MGEKKKPALRLSQSNLGTRKEGFGKVKVTCVLYDDSLIFLLINRHLMGDMVNIAALTIQASKGFYLQRIEQAAKFRLCTEHNKQMLN